MTEPRLPQLPAVLAKVDGPLSLSDGDKLEQQDFSGVRVGGNAKLDVTFEECRLTDVELITRIIKQFAVVDTAIERSRLFGLSVDGSLWRRAVLRHNQAVGMVLSASTLEDVTIEDCKLDSTNFRLAKLRRVIFRRCTLLEVDFSGATMTSVQFDDCQLDKATFDHLTATDVSLVGSQLGQLNGLMGLKGVTISGQQLIELSPQLAHELGLKIADQPSKPSVPQASSPPSSKGLIGDDQKINRGASSSRKQ